MQQYLSDTSIANQERAFELGTLLTKLIAAGGCIIAAGVSPVVKATAHRCHSRRVEVPHNQTPRAVRLRAHGEVPLKTCRCTPMEVSAQRRRGATCNEPEMLGRSNNSTPWAALVITTGDSREVARCFHNAATCLSAGVHPATWKWAGRNAHQGGAGRASRRTHGASGHESRRRASQATQ